MPANAMTKKRKLDSGFQSQARNKRKLRDGSGRSKTCNADSSNKRLVGDDLNEEIISSEDEEQVGELDLDGVGSDQDAVGEKDAFDVTFRQPDGDTNEMTAEELKLKMAKQYIEEVREKVRKFEQEHEKEGSEESEEGSEDEEDPETRKAAQVLRYESAVKSKLIRKNLSGSLTDTPVLEHSFRGHKNSITCGCVCSKGLYLYTGGKDCSIIKWSLSSMIRMWLIKSGIVPKKKKSCQPESTINNGHKSQINSLAISFDSKFLASASNEPEIFVWNPLDASLLYKLNGHKSSILSLKFKFCSHQLFSTSSDRFVKIWQVQDRTLMDNLCGHESPITDIDSISASASTSLGKPITCGSTDRTLRMWKIAESSQLIFSHNAFVDCVCYLTDSLFVTGDCNGAVCLWTTHKKKPLHSQHNAHAPTWVCCVSAIPYSDVVASGASDGALKIWKVTQPTSDSFQKLELITKIDTVGFITFITFTSDSRRMVFGLSNEPRLGRWDVIKTCKSSTHVYKIIPESESLEPSIETMLNS